MGTKRGLRKWGINVLVAIDQLINALSGGDPDETISSRIGKAKRRGNRLAKAACWVLAKVFGARHCMDAIEDDEGKDGVFRND
jgi:hypothetical protein